MRDHSQNNKKVSDTVQRCALDFYHFRGVHEDGVGTDEYDDASGTVEDSDPERPKRCVALWMDQVQRLWGCAVMAVGHSTMYLDRWWCGSLAVIALQLLRLPVSPFLPSP